VLIERKIVVMKLKTVLLAGLVCNALLEETGKGGADTQKHDDPEHRHDDSQRQSISSGLPNSW
jgi:hypothetical protein